jgi:hypothetical protein
VSVGQQDRLHSLRCSSARRPAFNGVSERAMKENDARVIL